jgi:hypothetical protein
VFPALQVLVSTTQLMMEGTILMPALLAAIKNEDCAAFAVNFSRFESFDGTMSPAMKIKRIVGRVNIGH